MSETISASGSGEGLPAGLGDSLSKSMPTTEQQIEFAKTNPEVILAIAGETPERVKLSVDEIGDVTIIQYSSLESPKNGFIINFENLYEVPAVIDGSGDVDSGAGADKGVGVDTKEKDPRGYVIGEELTFTSPDGTTRSGTVVEIKYRKAPGGGIEVVSYDVNLTHGGAGAETVNISQIITKASAPEATPDAAAPGDRRAATLEEVKEGDEITYEKPDKTDPGKTKAYKGVVTKRLSWGLKVRSESGKTYTVRSNQIRTVNGVDVVTTAPAAATGDTAGTPVDPADKSTDAADKAISPDAAVGPTDKTDADKAAEEEAKKAEYHGAFETWLVPKKAALIESSSKLAEMLYARSGRVVTRKSGDYSKQSIETAADVYKNELDSVCEEYINSLPEDERAKARTFLEETFASFKTEYKSEVSRRVTELRAEKLEGLGSVRKSMLNVWKKLSQMSRTKSKFGWKKLVGMGGKAAIFAPVGVVVGLLSPIITTGVASAAAAGIAVAGAAAIARGVARFKLDQLSEESERHEGASTEEEGILGGDTPPEGDDPEALEKAVQEAHDRAKANRKRAALAAAVAVTALIGSRLVGDWLMNRGSSVASNTSAGSSTDVVTGQDGTDGAIGGGIEDDAPHTGGPDTAEPGGPDVGTQDGGQEAGGDGAEGGVPELSKSQHDFANSGAKYPWDAAAKVYGADNASESLFKAVKAAKENGLDVKWHGSGENSWISVKGNSNGAYVIKQLAQYMPKK